MLTNPVEVRLIADIAAAVGMPNAAHFSRIFRDHYGLTPGELRATGNETSANSREPLAHPSGAHERRLPGYSSNLDGRRRAFPWP
jgi:AraC-like DNA-binding protein